MTNTVKYLNQACLAVGIDGKPCQAKAFVGVVLVGDEAEQKRIDTEAKKKINEYLKNQHEGGLHDG